MSHKEIDSVLEVLNPPKGFQPWHGGPSLLGALRGVDHITAAWKPVSDRHSIWELAVHIAYWKYSVRRYLDETAEQGFPKSPANWAKITDHSAKAWKEDKELIKQEHQMLIEAVEQFPENRLDEKIADGKNWAFRQLITGITVHDAYHIGQIQLMKRLYGSIEKK